jgi:cytochrome c-type biogenesis protein CcmF
MRRSLAARTGPLSRRLVDVVRADPGFWGGQLSHVGVAIVAVGIATSSLMAERATFTLDRGEEASFGGYQIAFVSLFEREEPNRLVSGANLALSRDGTVLEAMRPELRRFRNQVQPIETPAVYTSRTGEDVYLTLAGRSGNSITLNAYRYPLVSLVWIGVSVTAAGGVLAFALRRTAKRRAERESELVDA